MNKGFNIALMVLCVFVFAGSVKAEFYKWVDEEGVVHISNTPVAQGKEARKIDVISGGNKASSEDSGEWFNCGERSYRAGVAASELLEQEEGWSSKPVFDRYVRQFINGFFLELHLLAKLPEDEVKKTGCAYGFQTVKVKTEEDSENRGKCRILGAELGEKRLEPPGCRK